MSTEEFTANDKLICCKRELAMRRNVYPKWVRDGRMKADMATRQIALMEAIVADYTVLELKGWLNDPKKRIAGTPEDWKGAVDPDQSKPDE